MATHSTQAISDFFEVADPKLTVNKLQEIPTKDGLQILSPEMALLQDI